MKSQGRFSRILLIVIALILLIFTYRRLSSQVVEVERSSCVIDGVKVHPWFCQPTKTPPAEIIKDVEMLTWSGQITEYCWGALEKSQLEVCEKRKAKNSRVMAYPHPPSFWNEEALEWNFFMDLLESKPINSNFVFVELGAGFARWTVNAALVAKNYRSDLKYHGIAVETVPRSYSWMLQNLKRNNVADRITPVNGALWNNAKTLYVDGADLVEFEGKVVRWYGQGVYEDERPGTVSIQGITLEKLLSDHPIIDAIDADLQTAERMVFTEAAMPLLLKKVRAIHIETHTLEIHNDLLALFRKYNWKVTNNYLDNNWKVDDTLPPLFPLGSKSHPERQGQATTNGILHFGGGLLTVHNTQLY